MKRSSKKKNLWFQFQAIQGNALPEHQEEGTGRRSIRGARLAGHQICGLANAAKAKSILIEANLEVADGLALAEGVALSNYQFLKYFGDAKKRANSLNTIELNVKGIKANDLKDLVQ